ncbi:hypothetical protein Btru_015799 [Bulinus truncatus]|nr:hypothetical protein Btru_015799 [Bulinus truncatus]
MDTADADWSNLSVLDRDDSVSGAFQKQDDSSMGSLDNKSDQGDDEFASSLGIYDGYDSYNESGASTDNEDVDESLLDDDFLDNDEGVSKYRFLNNKDGMGKYFTQDSFLFKGFKNRHIIVNYANFIFLLKMTH